MFNIETMYGNIHYDENIIRKIIAKGVDEFNGKVLLYNNSKRLLVTRPGRKQAGSLQTGGANTIRITEEEDIGLEITVFIVVRFGTSISEVTDRLIDYIFEYMDRILRTRPARVTVKVTGVLSRNLVRRDIEVSRS